MARPLPLLRAILALLVGGTLLGAADRDRLARAFEKDIRAVWTAYRTQHPKRHPYALVMYGVAGAEPWIWPAILTEEGLTEVAKEYLRKGHVDTLEEGREGLRYSVADSPEPFALLESMPTVKAITGDLSWELLVGAATDALQSLDRQQVFGTGANRSGLLLFIYVEDSLQEFMAKSVRQLNPEEVAKRFEEQTRIEGEFRSCDRLAITPDGSYLFAANRVPDPRNPDTGTDVNQLVCYAVNGHALERRWQYQFPGFGDSVRAMAIAPKHRGVWALRAQYRGRDPSALIQRFTPENNAPVQEKRIACEPAAMAVSHNGSRLALLTHGKEILLLKSSLRLVHRVRLEAPGHDLLYLRNEDLLVATDSGLLRISPKGQVSATPVTRAILALSMDGSQTVLAVAHGVSVEIGEDQERPEYPVWLHELPSLRPLGKIHYPGHQLAFPTVSPDGRHLACRANRLHGDRKSTVLFELPSGKRIRETKTDPNDRPLFLPGSPAILIPMSEFMTTPDPIQFWNE